MGTRSLTHIKDHDGTTLCTLYRQFDGYPSCMGAAIKEALNGKLVNGRTSGQGICFNGMSYAASALVASLEKDPETVRIVTPDAHECGEEYVYVISPKYTELLSFGQTGEFMLKVYEGPMTAFGAGGDKIENLDQIYDGPLADFDPEMELD